MDYRIDDVIKRMCYCGFVVKSQQGSHIRLTKQGIIRPVILVKRNQSTKVPLTFIKIICKAYNIDINEFRRDL